MTEDTERKEKNHMKRLKRLQFFSRLFLTIEYFLSSFWVAFSWTAFFAALWLMNIPAFLGPFGHELGFVIFLIGLFISLHYALHSFRLPTEHDVNRRIEKANNLKHRPLGFVDDHLANPQKYETRSLWQKHKEKLRALLQHLRLPTIKPVIARRDPYALRMGAFILLVVAFVIAGSSWTERVKKGLFPFSIYELPGYSIDTATLTITPPEYTQKQAFILKGVTKDQNADVPINSEVKAQVSGGFGVPRLIIGEQEIPLNVLDQKNFGLKTTITDGTHLKIKQLFIERLSWPMQVIPDTPPSIALNGEAEITEYESIRIPLLLKDDYGVRDLKMHMGLNPIITEAPLGDPHEETRAMVTSPDEETEFKPVYDLTAHVWAGLPVIITLTAVDAADQKSVTSFEMTLPERVFKHPVAKKLIEHRKALAWDYNAPTDDMITSLRRLQAKPDDYNHDIVVLLALRTASSRLYFSPGEDTARALIDLFWDVAVHLEDGDLNLALRRLQEAQRELEQALSDPGASDEEIAQAVENLKQAMAEYFREMARELQKRMAEGEDMPLMGPEMFSQMINPEDLAQFFDQLQSEALDNPEKARELLSQLNKFLDMMNPSLSMSMPMDMQMMAEGVSELQELVRRQEELLDQTRLQASRMGRPQTFGDLLPQDPDSPIEFGDMPPPPQTTRKVPQQSTVNTSANKVEQDALRYILGQLMLDADSLLNEIPENMGLAEREMLSSSTQLGGNRPDLSIPHQEKAIEHLRDAMDDLSQQLMARMQQMTGMSLGQAQTDPLGRRFGQEDGGQNFFSGSDVQIPEEAERKRVQEILKILRERSGEFERPREELEYYRRLLKQF